MGQDYFVYDEADGNRILFSAGTLKEAEDYLGVKEHIGKIADLAKSFNYKVFNKKCIIIFQGNKADAQKRLKSDKNARGGFFFNTKSMIDPNVGDVIDPDDYRPIFYS